MLPRLYCPEWQNNLLEQRCLSIAQQLLGGVELLDFDQILAKRPHSADSAMAWHQVGVIPAHMATLHPAGHRFINSKP